MKTPIILLLLLSAGICNGQSFVKNKTGHALSFKEIQLQFDEFKKTNDLSKIKHWKSYKRYEHEMLMHTNGQGEPAGFADYVREAIAVAELKHKSAAPGTWAPVGPNIVPNNLTGYMENGIGRVNCVGFHPTDTNTYYVGVAQGGLWKTSNHGASYTPLTDNLPITRISDICIVPSSPNTIYISVCDFEYVGKGLYTDGRKRHTHFGLGVYKSTDGGLNWSATGLTFQLTNGDASLIRKIVVNPANTSELLACGVSGMYRSTDAGGTWTKQLDSLFWDMEQDPNNPSVIYAATGWVKNSNLGTAAIYKSTNFGSTWTMLNTGMPGQGVIQRTKLAVAPGNSNYVYALSVDDLDGLYGVYQSTDAGATWTLHPGYVNVLEYNDGSSSGGQGTYDLALAVNDTNENLIYTGGINMWASYDGGVNFSPVTHWTFSNGFNTIHADIHAIQQQPVSGNFFVSCDGGVYMTNQVDTGNFNSFWTTNWVNLSNNMQVTSFYRISSSRNNANRLVAGAQDNATFYLENNVWHTIFGGDGMDNYLDPADDDVIIGSSQYGNFYHSTDDGVNGNYILTNPWNESAEWVTPIVADYNNPGRLYIGNENVVRSGNGGLSWQTLGTIFSNTVTLANTEISALAVSPVDMNVIWAARRVRHEVNMKGLVFKTTNGSSFVNVTAGLPDTLFFTGIEASPGSASEAVVCMAGFAAGHKVYKTTNGGASWSNISYNLPNVPVNCIKYIESTEQLMVATDLGVFVMNRGANTWTLYSSGLPNVIVSDIDFNPVADKIFISTFGRGIWETSLSMVIALQPPVTNTSSVAQLNVNFSSRVFPSLSKGEFTIEHAQPQLKLQVIDVMGRKVHEQDLEQATTRLRLNLPPACYYLKLSNDKSMAVHKVVIE